MSFEQQANQVSRRSREGFIGQWAADSHLKRFESAINENPQRVEIWTAVVNVDPGDDADIVFRFTFDDATVDVTVNTGTGLDANGIAALIATELNQEGLLRGQVETTNPSTNNLTFTGQNQGVTFTPSVPTNPSTAIASITETQAAQTADDIPVGRAVCNLGYNNTNDGGIEHDYLGALASESLFSAQVQTLTVDTGEAVDMSVVVYEVMGSERRVLGSDTVTGNATAATQATSIRNAINAMMAADTVIASGTGADIIVTAEVAGLEFDVEVTAAGVSKVDTTGPSKDTSLHRAWGGISLFSFSDEALTIGAKAADIKANAGFRFASGGKIIVENSEGVEYGEAVYVELGTTDTGKLYNSAGADRVRLSRDLARWERADRASDNLNLAVLRLGPAY